jgi:DNA-binding NarL/FixJ family response regulator
VHFKWAPTLCPVKHAGATQARVRYQNATHAQLEGIEAAHLIRAKHPDIGVLVLSQHADEAYAFQLLKDGTAGLAYLLKGRVGDLEKLIHALHATVAGGSVIDPAVVDALFARQRRLARSPLRDLTPREMDVLREMAEGKTKATA